MKIDRLIGILSILLQQDKVTALYLSEKFEVSSRTIFRDIEALCKAGIPVVTVQGKNGGISIMDGYRLERTLLTSSDMQAILAGLRSLDSVSSTKKYQQLMEKLSAGQSDILMSNHHIAIDLSSWYKTTLAPKIEMLQAAADSRETVMFQYFSPKGESMRMIEPYLLVFQWASWYVWGYCKTRMNFRLFKLNRMQELKGTGEQFVPRQVPALELKNNKIFPTQLQITARFEPDMKWRLIEEYGPDSFTRGDDGRLYFEAGFSDTDSLFGWLLSFEAKVELLTPEELREEFVKRTELILNKYR